MDLEQAKNKIREILIDGVNNKEGKQKICFQVERDKIWIHLTVLASRNEELDNAVEIIKKQATKLPFILHISHRKISKRKFMKRETKFRIWDIRNKRMSPAFNPWDI